MFSKRVKFSQNTFLVLNFNQNGKGLLFDAPCMFCIIRAILNELMGMGIGFVIFVCLHVFNVFY